MKSNQAMNEFTVTNGAIDEASKWTEADLLGLKIVETEQSLLTQFRANLDQIEELNARLQFVLNEIRPFIR